MSLAKATNARRKSIIPSAPQAGQIAGRGEGKGRREIARLEKMAPMAAEAVVVRNYIDWMLSLPWSKTSKDRIDLDKAREILEADHYGLEKVKERILEFLAVRKPSIK